MPRKRTYSQTVVDELRRKLQEALAPEHELSTRQAVEALKGDLLDKQRQGWTLKDLAEWLSTNHFMISPSALGDYLNEDAKGKGTKKAWTNTKRKPTAKVAASDARMVAVRTDGAAVKQPDGVSAPDKPELEQKRLPLAGLAVAE